MDCLYPSYDAAFRSRERRMQGGQPIVFVASSGCPCCKIRLPCCAQFPLRLLNASMGGESGSMPQHRLGLEKTRQEVTSAPCELSVRNVHAARHSRRRRAPPPHLPHLPATLPPASLSTTHPTTNHTHHHHHPSYHHHDQPEPNAKPSPKLRSTPTPKA